MNETRLPLGDTYRTAYEIFCEELRTSVSMLESVSQKLCTAAPDESAKTLAEQAAQLKQRFHLLKGGAGFLKLERIADAAARGEVLLRDGSSEAAVAARSELETLVITLGEEVTSLEEALAMLLAR